jgi:hypothetical protein
VNWSRDCGEFGYFSTDLLPGGLGPQGGMSEQPGSRAIMNNHATRLGLPGVGGSDWNSSRAQMAAVRRGYSALALVPSSTA